MSAFGSNNPFRKRASLSPTVPSPQSQRAPQLEAVSPSPSLFDAYPPAPWDEEATAPGTWEASNPDQTPIDSRTKEPLMLQKQSTAKRVQIQTPPPLSPSTSNEDCSNSPSDTDPNADGSFLQNQGARAPSLDRDGMVRAEEVEAREKCDVVSHVSPSQLPFNPFASTSQDLEGGGRKGEPTQVQISRPKTQRASMDVDSFKRLLLTGHAGLPRADQKTPAPATLSTETARALPPAKVLDSSSTTNGSRQSSVFDPIPESPDTATPHDQLDEGPLASSPSSARRKQPPPTPASRHGKLIRVELAKDDEVSGNGEGSADLDRLTLGKHPSNVNKPLPPQPSAVSLAETPFNHEAAGKLVQGVEKKPQLPMLHTGTQNYSTTKPTGAKKAQAPEPPPTRRHARAESKTLRSSGADVTQGFPSTSPISDESQQPVFPPTTRRSSVESARSSTRVPAPAPPPPRRPNHQSRASTTSTPLVGPSFSQSGGTADHPGSSNTASLPTSVSNVAFAAGSTCSVSLDPPPIPRHSQHGGLALVQTKKFPVVPCPTAPLPAAGHEARDPLAVKASPPPPPPTRNSSTRRPPSIASFDLGSIPRKSGREGAPPPPPPPPPPKRGSRLRRDSKGSEACETAGRGSLDMIKPTLTEEAAILTRADEEVPRLKKSHAIEILADLDALKKELDALRGRYEQVGNAAGVDGKQA